MKKNRLFALVFRLFAFVIILIGVVKGGYSGRWTDYFFYTTQSNLLMLVLFFYLALRTTIDIISQGYRGSASYAPRLQPALLVMIIFTMLVFWILIAPFSSDRGIKLWSFSNLVVHTFSTIFALIDYIVFCEKGHFLKKDIFLSAIFPVAYIVQIIILGYSGAVFYVFQGIEQNFPYPFMDFQNMGFLSLIAVSVISLFYLGVTYIIYLFNHKQSDGKATASIAVDEPQS